MTPYQQNAGRIPTTGLRSYKEQEILMSSPEQCVLHLYDMAIRGCIQGQQEKASKALALLMDSLDFKAGGEISSRLFSLYEYCIRMVHERKFDSPQRILKGLRETWQAALTRNVAA